MDALNIKDLTFTYPGEEIPAIIDVNLSIKPGEFVLLMGPSGCGKTTLLMQTLPDLAPHGETKGSVTLGGEVSLVRQLTDEAIVTEYVWQELSFSLENRGVAPEVIRRRVGECAAFLGLNHLLHKKTTDLSSGEKSLLALGAAIITNPMLLVLDEPLSGLDPVARSNLATVLMRINRELSVAVLLCDHSSLEVFPFANRIICMERGRIMGEGILYAPDKVSDALDKTPARPAGTFTEDAIVVKNLYFRYEKKGRDILAGADIRIKKGSLTFIVGGNGAGKSTFLRCLCLLETPFLGSMEVMGVKVLEKNRKALIPKCLVYLPREIKTVLTKERVKEELPDPELLKELGLYPLRDRHPYDLSGGELGRLGIGMALYTGAKVLLLDEPTSGIDPAFKAKLGEIFHRLCNDGYTIVCASHDLEFAEEFGDYVSMMFFGSLTKPLPPEEFFKDNLFYTTARHRREALDYE